MSQSEGGVGDDRHGCRHTCSASVFIKSQVSKGRLSSESVVDQAACHRSTLGQQPSLPLARQSSVIKHVWSVSLGSGRQGRWDFEWILLFRGESENQPQVKRLMQRPKVIHPEPSSPGTHPGSPAALPTSAGT